MNEARMRLEEQLRQKTLEKGQTADTLVRFAFDMMRRAYAPYSHFTVGAALLGRNGKIYTGCNVENAAYSPTCCAERTAFFNAVADGCRKFEAIAVVGGHDGNVTDFCPPCGVCRQVMTEFCGPEFMIILAKSHTERKVYQLRELLPESFKLN